jgi:uncharacterized protein (DUF3820 family)
MDLNLSLSDVDTTPPEPNSWQKGFSQTIEKLAEEYLTFGKHKGKLLEHVPKNYILWAVDKGILILPNGLTTLRKIWRGEILALHPPTAFAPKSEIPY